MQRLACIVLAALALTSAGQADEFAWIDEWTAGDLPAYGQVSVPLATVKPESLQQQPNWGEAKVRHATFTFAQSQEIELPVVVAVVETADGRTACYVDADGDGSMTEEERASMAGADARPPGFGKPTDTVWLASLSKPFQRTAAFRLHPFGGLLTCALRGYGRADLPVAEAQRQALLIDANANMLLDLGADRLYVDDNGDGSLDPKTERRGVPPRLDLADTAFSFSAERPFHLARWYLAPTGDVPVRFAVTGLREDPTKLVASLSRLGGGVYQIISIAEEATLPAGSYNLDSLFIRLTDEKETVWTYTFERHAEVTPTELVGEQPVTVELLGAVALAVSYAGEPKPGEMLSVTVNARSDTGLTMTACTKGAFDIGGRGEIPATLSLSRLFDPKQILSSKMGFG